METDLRERLIVEADGSRLLFHSRSQLETTTFAQHFGRFLPGGSIIGFRGELGAGKTEFVRGLARGLGIEGVIPSPTFVLEVQYPIRRTESQTKKLESGTLHHWDLYRLANGHLPPDLREACERDDTIVAIEWFEKCPELKDLLSFQVQIDFPPSAVNETSAVKAASDAAFPGSQNRVVTVIANTDFVSNGPHVRFSQIVDSLFSTEA